MDTTKRPTEIEEANPAIRTKILEIMDNGQGTYWGDLYDALTPEYTVVEIRVALNSLVRDKTLRQREDSHEHDWEYRRNNSA